MKLRIFYRHYNIEGSDNKGRPDFFDFEKCFINLLNTIKRDSRVELHVVMDGKIEDNWIGDYKDKFIGHEIKAGDDYNSFLETYKIAKSLQTNEKDLYYFLENDYLHDNGWVDRVFELFEKYHNLNYVSLYDHNDKYIHSRYQNLVSKIIHVGERHWRTTPSTCGTYIVNKKIFLEDYDVPFQMKGDHNKFIWLAQNKKRFVLTPIPGLSTHCMGGLMSPGINWKIKSL